MQYGVTVIGRLVRTRHAGRTLVDEARARSSGGHRARIAGSLAAKSRLFGETVDYVLRNARCKVMVGASADWRGPQRPSKAPAGVRQ